MKNVTISLDDETYRRARIKAAELGTSLSALVKRYLTELGAAGNEVERLKAEERALRASIADFKGGDRLSRDDIHDRKG